MKKKFILLFLALLIANPINVKAYIPDTEYNENDISSYKQFSASYSSVLLNPSQNTTSTVATSSCGYYALTTILNKYNQKITPLELINKVKENNIINTNWGHIDFDRISEISNIKLADINDDNIIHKESYQYYFNANLTKEDKKEILINLLNQNYLIMADMDNGENGHYIAFDYYDKNENDFRITDSAYPVTWLNERYQDFNIKYMIIFEPKQSYSVYKDENALEYNRMVKDKENQENNVNNIIDITTNIIKNITIKNENDVIIKTSENYIELIEDININKISFQIKKTIAMILE